MSLKNVQTEDLTRRWSMLIDEYLEQLKQVKEILISVDKKRNELLLIREELVLRNVEVDVPEDQEACPAEPQKT